MGDFTEEEIANLGGSRSANKPEDPTGQFPADNHLNKENINTQARGETRNSLKWAASSEGVSQHVNKRYISSIYPYNQVSRSITGHIIEVDDTPGNERMLIKHADGAGIELCVDGGMHISALGNKVEVTGGDQHITIVGDAKIVYQGNVDMKVGGEFNIECNEFNLDVKNNKTEKIGGAEIKEIFKGATNYIVGSVTNFITNQKTDTVLGGHQYNVKGNVDYNINGNVGFYSSGEMNVTSEDYINLASDNVTASANNMTIQGGNGVIGGDSVHIKGQEASFEGSVEAPTFYGNLIGKAKFAGLADKATGADTAGATGSSGTASYPSDPGAPTFVEPTTSKVSDYLTKAAGGIRKVKIDIGNYIKDFLDRSNRYDGVSAQAMSAKTARSKLRDPANRNNNKLVSALIEEGTLCDQFNNPNPQAIGRIVDGKSTTVKATKNTNPKNKTNNVIYIPKNVIKQFLPNPAYNPMNIGTDTISEITAKTKLSPNISLSKFLGNEDPVNIKYIRDENKKKNILKHLYPQVVILKQINANQDELEGISLEVTEGLYRPGSGETITAGSINDLKSKGRAVAYKAIDLDGKANNSRLFDIAAWLKDNAYFDELILSYDTNECIGDNPILSGRIIITMPEIDDNFTGNFKREVYTEFNGNRLSQGELVEVLLSNDETNLYYVEGGNQWVLYRSSLSQFNKDIRPELYNKLVTIAKAFGRPLEVTSGRRPPTSTAGVGSRSKHVSRDAVDILTPFNDKDTERLIQIAISNGIRGIGIYREPSRGGGSTFNGLHLDIRSGSKAAWGDNYSRTSLYRYPWAHTVLNKNGFPTS